MMIINGKFPQKKDLLAMRSSLDSYEIKRIELNDFIKEDEEFQINW